MSASLQVVNGFRQSITIEQVAWKRLLSPWVVGMCGERMKRCRWDCERASERERFH